MIKQVFIPLVVSGQKQEDLLELYVKPCWLKPQYCFAGLAGSGLNNGIALAERALTQLHVKSANAVIYSGNAHPLLTHTLGTAAGLVLASIIQSKSCKYQSLIISAAIEDNPQASYPLKYSSFWLEKLQAVLTLPKQLNKTPFILAADTPLSDEQHEQLIERNIYPILMPNLKQAIDFCLTPSETKTS